MKLNHNLFCTTRLILVSLLMTNLVLMSCTLGDTKDPKSQILNNGTRAVPSAFPAVVKITADNGGTCTGTNMGAYILTAAHCVEIPLGDGIYDLIEPPKIHVFFASGKKSISATRIQVSPSYGNDRMWKHDLAKIYVPESATQFEAKATLGGPVVKGSSVTIVGFGCTFNCQTADEHDEGTLHSGSNRVSDVTEFLEITGPHQRQSPKGQTVAYPGDSGSPLLDSKGQVVGVLSRSSTYESTTQVFYIDVNETCNKAFVDGIKTPKCSSR